MHVNIATGIGFQNTSNDYANDFRSSYSFSASGAFRQWRPPRAGLPENHPAPHLWKVPRAESLHSPADQQYILQARANRTSRTNQPLLFALKIFSFINSVMVDRNCELLEASLSLNQPSLAFMRKGETGSSSRIHPLSRCPWSRTVGLYTRRSITMGLQSF